MVHRHVLVLASVLTALCSCATNPARQEQSTANDSNVLRAHLIEKEWMLNSRAYPAITSDGYPIGFEADGRLRTRNLGLTESWRLTEDLTLELLSISGQLAMALPFDSDVGVFVFQPEVGPAFVIGPHGFHFDQYLNKLAAHGNRAH